MSLISDPETATYTLWNIWERADTSKPHELAGASVGTARKEPLQTLLCTFRCWGSTSLAWFVVWCSWAWSTHEHPGSLWTSISTFPCHCFLAGKDRPKEGMRCSMPRPEIKGISRPGDPPAAVCPFSFRINVTGNVKFMEIWHCIYFQTLHLPLSPPLKRKQCKTGVRGRKEKFAAANDATSPRVSTLFSQQPGLPYQFVFRLFTFLKLKPVINS